jgi:hypothetical protein
LVIFPGIFCHRGNYDTYKREQHSRLTFGDWNLVYHLHDHNYDEVNVAHLHKLHAKQVLWNEIQDRVLFGRYRVVCPPSFSSDLVFICLVFWS